MDFNLSISWAISWHAEALSIFLCFPPFVQRARFFLLSPSLLPKWPTLHALLGKIPPGMNDMSQKSFFEWYLNPLPLCKQNGRQSTTVKGEINQSQTSRVNNLIPRIIPKSYHWDNSETNFYYISPPWTLFGGIKTSQIHIYHQRKVYRQG